jgi:Na+-transporting NADH:ubiquinone oxidoreductase subunit F
MNALSVILLGVGMFTGIVLALVAVILAAKSKLVASGRVRIVVNGEEASALEAPAGGKLLGALAERGIFLSSACGGGGTCGQCRVQVVRGGGSLLPTEASVLSRRQAREGFRLSCQVSVKEDLWLEVPAHVFNVRKWRATVRSNRLVATYIKELVLDLPPGETIDFRAGGYIEIEAPPHRVAFRDFDLDPRFRPDWESSGLLGLESAVDEPVVRAYSMANCPDEKDVVMLNVRIAAPPAGKAGVPPGRMSSYLFGLRPGDPVSVSGPFGEFFARDTQAEMVFIGGGAGMAPMRSHLLDQLGRLGTKRKISFWYGARALREAFYRDLFDGLAARHPNFTWTLALSEPNEKDCREGCTGFIHQVLHDRYLKGHPAPEDCEYYLCGPPLMNKAVLAMLDGLGVEPENILFDDFGI